MALQREAPLFLPKKAMENYKKVFIQIEDIKFGTITKEKISYPKSVFIRDFLRLPDLDWEDFFKSLLDRTIDAEGVLLSMLDEINYVVLDNHLEYDFESSFLDASTKISVENHKGQIVEFKRNSSVHEKFSMLINLNNNLKEFKNEIYENLEYYRAEKDNPPYKEIFINSGKIPFFGSQAEFSALFYSLVAAGFLGINDANEIPKKEFANLSTKKFNDFLDHLPEKRRAIKALSESFFLLTNQNEENNFSSKSINTEAVEKKFKETAIKRLGRNTTENVIKKLEKAIKFLKTKDITTQNEN